MKRFIGRTAIVTGAATGIGRAIAVRLASEGVFVTVAHKPRQVPQPTLSLPLDTAPVNPIAVF